MTDVPFGVIFSRGLDSYLVASMAYHYILQLEAAC